MAQKRTSHFLTGAIIGVGLGILLENKKGSKTSKENIYCYWPWPWRGSDCMAFSKNLRRWER